MGGLSPELVLRQLRALVRAGRSIPAAARLVGISKDTAYRYLAAEFQRAQLRRQRRAAEVERQFALGRAVADAARRAGISQRQAYRILQAEFARRREERRRKRGKTERLLRAAKLTISEIARRVGIHKARVSELRQRQLAQELESAGERLHTRRLQRPRRCPVHGLLHVWPCVACAALAANRKQP